MSDLLRERGFVGNQCRWLWFGDEALGLWPERVKETEICVRFWKALIWLLLRHKTSAQVHSSPLCAWRAVPLSLSLLISQLQMGQKGEWSVQAQRRAWKAELLNKKIFVKMDRFDYIKSKTVYMLKPHKPNWQSNWETYLQFVWQSINMHI